MAMSALHHISRVCVGLCLAIAIPTAAVGQERHARDLAGGPLSGPPVFDAPFSADATTTFTETGRDGTRTVRTTNARYYRDREGRVRVEQMSEQQIRVTVHPDSSGPIAYLLHPAKRTIRVEPRDLAGVAVGGGISFALPLDVNKTLVFDRDGDERTGVLGAHGDVVNDESLGHRRIAGVDSSGRRLTLTIPVARIGNDRPIEIVDERWESEELRLVIDARYSDPRTGVIEYQLTNIRLAEPPQDLFVIPPDYSPDKDPWISLIPPEKGEARRR